MKIEVWQITPAELAVYATVPIAFEVRSRLRVEPVDGGLGGICLVEEPVDPPYWKDYDADERPVDWPGEFDVSRWAFFLAGDRSAEPVGAAAVAFNTPGVHMLENRADLAVLWDIRVRPEARGRGAGAALFRAAEDWARARGCRELKIETQNINTGACRFYARMGAVLGAIHTRGYAGTPYADETMLLWYQQL